MSVRSSLPREPCLLNKMVDQSPDRVDPVLRKEGKGTQDLEVLPDWGLQDFVF